MKFSVTMPRDARYQIALYWNSLESWSSVYNSDLNCTARISQTGTMQQLHKGVSPANIESLTNTTVTVNSYWYFTIMIPRWYFMVISNCDPDPGDDTSRVLSGNTQGDLDVSYKMEFVNGMSDDPFVKHFSADRLGMFETTIVLLFAQSALGLFMWRVAAKLSRIRKYHVTVKLLTASIVGHWLALAMRCGYYDDFSRDGIERPTVRFWGRFLSAVSEMVFLLLLVLLAKGWTIVRYKLSAAGRIKIAAFISTYFMVTVTAYIWADRGYTDADVVYYYASPPGRMLIWLRVAGAAWLAYANYTTMHNHGLKKGFYRKFSFFSVLWCASMPIAIAAVESLDEYKRQKVIYGCELATFFAAQVNRQTAGTALAPALAAH